MFVTDPSVKKEKKNKKIKSWSNKQNYVSIANNRTMTPKIHCLLDCLTRRGVVSLYFYQTTNISYFFFYLKMRVYVYELLRQLKPYMFGLISNNDCLCMYEYKRKIIGDNWYFLKKFTFMFLKFNFKFLCV